MAIVVVGGSGRSVGKTTLMCGLIAAMPELEWVAVKITSDVHAPEQPVWEEGTAGEETDTARYLAAGARRAFLLTAAVNATMQTALDELWRHAPREANMIFESNRVLDFIKPDVCLVVRGAVSQVDAKASFEAAMRRADAILVHSQTGAPAALGSERQIFCVERFERLPDELVAWIRRLLIYR